MTINLVQQMGPAQAHKLLESSFAQYQADRSVVGLRARHRAWRTDTRRDRRRTGWTIRFSTTSGCALQISERERAQSRASRLQRRRAANDALASLRRGDIITITHGRRGGLAVVLESACDEDDPRPLVLTENRWAGRISSADYSGTSAPLGSMSLPKRVEHRNPRARRDLASALNAAAARPRRPADQGQAQRTRRQNVTSTPNWPGCVNRCASHPAHRLPDREEKARLAERYLRIERDNEQIRQKVAAATNSLARTFDRIVVLLTERGFIRGRATTIRRSPTTVSLLARIYSESDLLVAECLRTGVWEGLDAAELAGVLSAVLFEAARRHAGRAATAWTSRPAELRRALNQTRRLWSELRADEQRHRITGSREPDDGFVAAIYRWATTGDLAGALAASDTAGSGSPLSAGDFVRWCRQVLDLARPGAQCRT